MHQEKKYHLLEILENYKKWYVKRAPNSIGTAMLLLENYAFYYFIQRKNILDLTEWPRYYDDFREWLEDEATLIRYPDRPISYSTKNGCIKALNNFMRYMHLRRHLPQFYICEHFAPHLCNKRSVDDLVTLEEMETIYETLIKKGHRKDALFFRLAYVTGMRFNEIFGLSIENIYKGTLEDPIFAQMLAKNKIDSYFGYLVFDSQPATNKSNLRLPSGEIPRKPLKNKKEVSEREARTLIITDQITWDGLTELHNQQVEKFHQRIHTENIQDYILFDGITRATATRRLQEAFTSTGLPFRPWHCLRHSCATRLIGETGDLALVKLWLGHTSPRTIERYNHLYQAIIRKAKKPKMLRKL